MRRVTLITFPLLVPSAALDWEEVHDSAKSSPRPSALEASIRGGFSWNSQRPSAYLGTPRFEVLNAGSTERRNLSEKGFRYLGGFGWNSQNMLSQMATEVIEIVCVWELSQIPLC